MTSEGGGSSRPYISLFWRVFAINAVILSLAALVTVIVLSPGTISPPVAVKELGILVGALAVMVVVNLVLVRRIIAPLGELMALMRRADPVRPGERVTVGGPPSEARELAETFNEMPNASRPNASRAPAERLPPRSPSVCAWRRSSTTRSGRTSPPPCCSSAG